MSVFLPQEFLARIRDGEDLDKRDIERFISGIANGKTDAAQIGAFVMAVRLKGLNRQNTVHLTEALRDSGDVMRWDLPGPIVDKHSTGGVGDNVSLLLAPIIAACGGYVPMISGQGLGHTGGTLDKLASIPGYRVDADTALFRKTVREIGCAIIGQTSALAPADKVLYATRSATAAVDSIPLITASILSKKLAEGLEALILDIKCGNGAMMQNPKRAEELARSLLAVAEGAGVKTAAMITDMNQSLASAAGNALEVINIINHFQGQRDERLHEIVRELSAGLLVISGLSDTHKNAFSMVDKVFDNGKAAEKFALMVAALGGPNDILQNPDKHFEPAPIIMDVFGDKAGIISHIDTKAIGLAVIVLGGGRKKPSDKIDPRVGFDNLLPIGAKVDSKTPIARIHAACEQTAQAAGKMLQNAYMIGATAERTPLIIKPMGDI